MKSPLAEPARQERLEQERRMTPGHRLQAFLNHSQLMTRLYLAGCAVIPESPDLDLLRRSALQSGRDAALTLETLLP